MTEHISAKDWKAQYGGEKDINKKILYKSILGPMGCKLTKPKKKRATVTNIERTEHEIQSNILERLNFLKNAFFWRENSGAFALEHQGKKRFFRAGTPGIADIMGLWNGVPVAIEVKRPKTKKNVSVDQKAFLQRFRDCGGVGIVCWDDSIVVKQIEEAISNLPK